MRMAIPRTASSWGIFCFILFVVRNEFRVEHLSASRTEHGAGWSPLEIGRWRVQSEHFGLYLRQFLMVLPEAAAV